MKQSIKNVLKVFFKKRVFLIKLVAKFSEWQYSKFLPQRWLGQLLSFPCYYLLRDDYYKLLMLVKKNELAQPGPGIFSRFLVETFYSRAISGDQSASVDEYQRVLQKIQFSDTKQFEWADRFMGLGRLDLARVGFLELINRPSNQVSAEVRFKSLRYAGIACFLLGKNSEANHYWRLTGYLRKAQTKPTTPTRYKVLGHGWRAAIGHIAMLDCYLKYLSLYGEEKLRIVAPWLPEQVPTQELLKKFISLGITMIDPANLESDYNQWAEEEGHCKWNELSAMEKAVMEDDFWEYEFPNGVILGFAHAMARIQHEWEQAQRPPLFSLSEAEKKWIGNYLSNFGLPKGAWYVCLHVREPGFHQSWNTLYPSMRDANIADYGLAIDAIVKAGGWVLRMGDPSMKPLPPMDHVIDYAHSPFKSQTADILLAAGCKFILGTNSGYVNLCTMYNVPCALTNWVPIGWPLWMGQDLMIPKLFREKKSGRYLNIEQIFEQNLAFLQNWKELPEHIELVANTPEEIAALTLEMLAQCEANKDQGQAKVAAPSLVQNYYAQVAKRYESFTGSRLAKSFVDKHANVFAPAEGALVAGARVELVASSS